MTLTWQSRSKGKEPRPSAFLPAINLTWADLGLNPSLDGQRPTINGLSNGNFLTPFFFVGGANVSSTRL